MKNFIFFLFLILTILVPINSYSQIKLDNEYAIYNKYVSINLSNFRNRSSLVNQIKCGNCNSCLKNSGSLNQSSLNIYKKEILDNQDVYIDILRFNLSQAFKNKDRSRIAVNINLLSSFSDKNRKLLIDLLVKGLNVVNNLDIKTFDEYHSFKVNKNIILTSPNEVSDKAILSIDNSEKKLLRQLLIKKQGLISMIVKCAIPVKNDEVLFYALNEHTQGEYKKLSIGYIRLYMNNPDFLGERLSIALNRMGHSDNEYLKNKFQEYFNK